MVEKFKPVKGYTGIYEISNLGRVKSLSRVIERNDGNTRVTEDRIILPFTTKAGYSQIVLCKDGVKKKHYIHRLVALAFIPNDNPIEKIVVNHKDENPINNNVGNLEWCTQRYNMRYGKMQAKLIKINVIDSKGDVVDLVEGIRECERKYSISKYLIKQSSNGKDLIKDNKCNFNFKIA
ncbi:NUMOD4 domain-containing protein [Prevotella pallens]|uniref:NUMOD4 domain-containing protein n=1 Tax=Prevotella pallens TaxID=60133 RepID=UPI0028DB475E|nr:NUMOD4 domain-containing protein [Prevotella pallens]